MFWTIFVIQAVLCGIFGWLIGELIPKCAMGKIDFKLWKAIAIWFIFLFVIFSAGYLVEKGMENKVYNTKEYAIETVDTTFETDSTEVTSFKIVRK